MESPVIDRALIEKIAQLASLELDEEEKTLFTRQFQAILEVVHQVQDAPGQPDSAGEVEATPLREDTPRAAEIDPRRFSPHVENGFFTSPRYFEA